MRITSRSGLRLFLATGSIFLSATLYADTIYLKNGAVIPADAWEIRGDLLVVRQGTGRIHVPRSDVLRIEPGGQGSQAQPSPAPAGAPPAGATTTSPIEEVSDERIAEAVEALKRRIDDYPMAREENTRRLVLLFDQLGWRALKGRNFEAAQARFREALGYDTRDAKAQLGLATTYFRTDQDVFARSTLERALLDHPDDPDLHRLLGEVYYSQERIEEALSEWNRAYDLKPDKALKSRIDKLTRERSVDGAYRQSEAAHFTLKYDGDRAGADLGAQILEFLEGQFRELETRFDHYPLQPIVVILYPHRQFYEATRAESSVAGLFDGKIRVPIGGLQQIDAGARHVLLHELAHAFITGKSRGTAPRWLQEGLAQRIEGRETATAAGTTLAKEFQVRERKEGWGESFSYASALSFVEYLDDRLGFPALVDTLAAMGKGASPEAAFQEVTRYSLPELRVAWGESLTRKYLQ